MDLVLNIDSDCLHRVLVYDSVDFETFETFCGFKFFSVPIRVMTTDQSLEGEACKRCNKIVARYFEPWLARDVSSSSGDGGQ